MNLGFREGSMDCINGDETEKLVADLKEKFPLIHAVIQELLVSNSKSEPSVGKSIKCGVHSLVLLLTLRNKQLKNGFQLIFWLLCIGYGAGMRFINMLHKMGFCLHWDTLMTYLDKQIENVKNTLKSKFPMEVPLIALMDNINVYRNKARHDRLFKKFGKKMWNFTGLGALVPNVSQIEHLFSDKETALESQIPLLELSDEHALIESHQELNQIWENFRDRYFLSILDRAINNIPECEKDIEKMIEKEINAIIKSIKDENGPQEIVKIEVPDLLDIISEKDINNTKSDVNIMNLSIEDNSTFSGTANILNDLAQDFSIPCKLNRECIPLIIRAIHLI